MTLAQLQSFPVWAALFDYAAQLMGFLARVFAGEALYRLHSRWVPLGRDQCDAAAYQMPGLCKLGLSPLFVAPWFVAPWIARCLVRGGTP